MADISHFFHFLRVLPHKRLWNSNEIVVKLQILSNCHLKVVKGSSMKYVTVIFAILTPPPWSRFRHGGPIIFPDVVLSITMIKTKFITFLSLDVVKPMFGMTYYCRLSFTAGMFYFESLCTEKHQFFACINFREFRGF